MGYPHEYFGRKINFDLGDIGSLLEGVGLDLFGACGFPEAMGSAYGHGEG